MSDPNPIHAPTQRARRGLVCSVDQLATGAGVRTLAAGGSAADAAVATSAALAVVSQHLCGMGGDLFALVHGPGLDRPDALSSAGRAGSGASADGLRTDGYTSMPFRGDIRSVTVPGCVDGWWALWERHGRLPWADVLAPALELAEEGFPASPLLAASAPGVLDVDGGEDFRVDGRPVRTGEIVTRPRQAAALAALALGGRDAWYRGRFGDGLVRLGDGLFTADDLARSQARWDEPWSTEAFGHRVWTVPAPSQGYLALATAAVAERAGLGADPDDPAWAHLLVEASKAAGSHRPDELFDGALEADLLDPARLDRLADQVDPARAADRPSPRAGGGTIYLCAADGDGMGVSLIQSNAAGFGVHLAVPEVGVFLHNRGLGFSLEPGHPAELAPGRRPPSTLSPTIVTRPDGTLRAIVGTMGGDTQPQVVAQLLARLLSAGQSPGTAISASRFGLYPEGGGSGFDTWAAPGLGLGLETGTPWDEALAARGHVVRPRPWAQGFGHAHAITAEAGHWAGAADPRALVGAAAGL